MKKDNKDILNGKYNRNKIRYNLIYNLILINKIR